MSDATPDAATLSRLVGSPVCLRDAPYETVLDFWKSLNVRKFEAFTGFTSSQFDLSKPAEEYRKPADARGMEISSFHLPPIKEEGPEALAPAVEAAAYAQACGAKVVLFKAKSRDIYIAQGRPFLDAIAERGIDVIPVLQNHAGSPISSLDDMMSVVNGIGDERMKVLLEVGHYARIKQDWREAAGQIGMEQVALVHINEINDEGKSVPYGTGSVDFAGLFGYLSEHGYRGDVVVELELGEAGEDERRKRAAEALQFLLTQCPPLK